MSRHTALLLIGALAPAMTACATAGPEPMVVARADAAVPPMPAELAMATNGKADAPFQVETVLMLAAQMQRESAAPRVARPAPLETARAAAPPSPSAQVQVARAASSALAARSRTPKDSPSRVAGELSALETEATATPAAPIQYAELPRADAVSLTLAASPARVANQIAAAPRAAARRSGRATVRYASAAPIADRFPVVAPTSPHPSRVVRVAERRDLRNRSAARPEVTFRRIRMVITGWLKAIRI